MDKADKDAFLKFLDYLKKVYHFDGLYHFTDFSNLKTIFLSGYLKSRAQCEYEGNVFYDCANTEIINETSEEIKKCVRFYYKEKTPMLYKTEGIKANNMPPHVPIPVYLIFDEKLIYQWDTFFTDGNARSDFSSSGTDFSFFSSMDWGKIFHRGSLPNEETLKREYVRKRHAELLCRNPVSTRFIRKIVFRCEADKQRAINLFGNKSEYLVNHELFNNRRNYIKDYKIDINKDTKEFKLHYEFNDYTYRNYKFTFKVINKNGDVLTEYEFSYPSVTGLRWVHTNPNYDSSWYKVEVYMGETLSIEEFIK